MKARPSRSWASVDLDRALGLADRLRRSCGPSVAGGGDAGSVKQNTAARK